ncbi:MAG TPA: hypothetical protein VH062_29970 [Polyangiaceae bacterium]|nr:hypothetical protein [Polyangiaceae bacterium]
MSAPPAERDVVAGSAARVVAAGAGEGLAVEVEGSAAAGSVPEMDEETIAACSTISAPAAAPAFARRAERPVKRDEVRARVIASMLSREGVPVKRAA